MTQLLRASMWVEGEQHCSTAGTNSNTEKPSTINLYSIQGTPFFQLEKKIPKAFLCGCNKLYLVQLGVTIC